MRKKIKLNASAQSHPFLFFIENSFWFDKVNISKIVFESMKNVIAFLLIILYACQPSPKLTPKDYTLEDLKSCVFDYEHLTIKRGVKSKERTYLFQKKKFTGCAKQKIESQSAEVGYYVFEILDGKIEREICVYPSGQLERDFKFKAGVPHGKHLMWYGDGKPYIEHIFENGHPLKMLRWFRNGQLAQETYFENGEKFKEVKYHQDGKIQKEE